MVPDPMVASNWEIGPIINGVDYSTNMPIWPEKTTDGWGFDFPTNGIVGYVTFRYGPLAGKTHIVMDYRVETDPNVVLHPKCCPGLESVGPTMFFQEKDDDWRTDGKRWWATFNSPAPIQAGSYHMDIPLKALWSSVYVMNAETNPTEFAEAIQNTDRVGFTFGGGDGYGHGVYADGKARFIVTSFKIE
jgi:hypothetical protein